MVNHRTLENYLKLGWLLLCLFGLIYDVIFSWSRPELWAGLGRFNYYLDEALMAVGAGFLGVIAIKTLTAEKSMTSEERYKIYLETKKCP